MNKKEKLSLLQHLRKCDDGRDSKCEVCGEIIKGKMKLTSHKRVHQKIECAECGMEMPVGSLNDHMKCHQMKSPMKTDIKCIICLLGPGNDAITIV